jgi:transposase
MTDQLRQPEALRAMGVVIAPSMMPPRPGERIKTDRRDAITLARLVRAGELAAVWVPDESHEAVRDLVRARRHSKEDLSAAEQSLLSFLLRACHVVVRGSDAHCNRWAQAARSAAWRHAPNASARKSRCVRAVMR